MAKAVEKIVELPGVQAAIKTAEKAPAPVVTTVKNAAAGLSERNRLTTLGRELEKLDALDAAKRADFGNKPPRLFGGKRVPQATLDAYAEEMKKHGIKVVLDADATLKKLDPNGYAAFDYEKKVLLLPKGVTELGLFHENQHILHYLEVGPESYKAAGKLAREERVYEAIIKNKHLFNSTEVQEAAKYIERVRLLKTYGKCD